MRGGKPENIAAKKQFAQETGRMIKQLRIDRGFSQEKLASGICAVSTLSRIESGINLPSRELFIQLMKRLGISDDSYGGMYSPREIVINSLKYQLITALEFGRLKETTQWLWTLKQLIRQDDVSGRQFMALIEILMRNEQHEEELCQKQTDMKSEIQWQNEMIHACVNALQMTIPDFHTDQTLEHLPLTRVEMILINNLGLACIYSGRYRTAVHLLSDLEECLSKKVREDASFIRPLAIVRNNLAVCVARMDLCTEALHQINQAIRSTHDCGSAAILARLLHTRMIISRSLNDMDAYYADYHVLLSLAGIVPSGEGSKRKVARLLGQRPGIRVL